MGSFKRKRAEKKFNKEKQASAFRVHNAMADADNWEASSGPNDFYSDEDNVGKVFKAPKGAYSNNNKAVADMKSKGKKGYYMPHHVDLTVQTVGGVPMHLGYSFVDRYANANPHVADLTNAKAFHKALLATRATQA